MSKPALSVIAALILYAAIATERWHHWKRSTLEWQGQYMRLQHMEDDAVQKVIELTKEVERLKG